MWPASSSVASIALPMVIALITMDYRMNRKGQRDTTSVLQADSPLPISIRDYLQTGEVPVSFDVPEILGGMIPFGVLTCVSFSSRHWRIYATVNISTRLQRLWQLIACLRRCAKRHFLEPRL